MEIRFILVEPKVPENIGAAARAIKTMGFNSLALVNPVEWREGKALWVAHGSADILENATVHDSLKEALKEDEFAVATTAKYRSVSREYIPADELGGYLKERTNIITKVALVFGREESGLTNDEIKLCDLTTSVPMAVDFPSLNLSQAVMLYAWELSDIKHGVIWEPIMPDTDSVASMKRKVSELLNKAGMSADDNRYGRILDRLSMVTEKDINLFHSVAAILLEKIGEKDD